jgi:hypothetical protein
MTQHMTRLLLTLLILAGVSQSAQGQLPRRGTEPVTPTDPSGGPPVPVRDPSVAPPLPTTEPQLGAPAVVQPGTVLREPVARATRQLKYIPAGEVPGAVQVTATGPRSVTLSWTAPAGASGYWIHQAGPGQTTYYRGSSLVTETTAMVTGLLPATSYGFKVSAVYPQELQRGEGMSGAVTATTAAAPLPTGLTASVVGRGKVSLRWDALPGADGFRLSRNDTTLKDIKPVSFSGGTSLATTLSDSVMPGIHRYQIQAVYRASGVQQGADVLSAAAPTPAVSVTIPASSRVRFCQTRAGAARCAEPGTPYVIIAARTLP